MFLRRTSTMRPSPPSMIASAVGKGLSCSGIARSSQGGRTSPELAAGGASRARANRFSSAWTKRPRAAGGGEVRGRGVLGRLVHGLPLLLVVEIELADRDLVEPERESA